MQDFTLALVQMNAPLGKVATRRRSSCFNLQTRRPELYGELAALTD
jgi:hypothetical protein